MTNDAVPALDELISDRLEELLFGGHITQVQYQEAILGHPLPSRIIAEYLNVCLSLPASREV